MNDAQRKKSPRAPSLPLAEAIDGALKIYSNDRRHPIPVDLAAQHLGYKNANNGSATKTIASIRYFGLLGRSQEGHLVVEKEVEDYNFAPDPQQKNRLLRKWLLTPPVFAEVLNKYSDALPSDAALKFDLIQRGFLPDAAEALIPVLKSSVDFARYYDRGNASEPAEQTGSQGGEDPSQVDPSSIPSNSLPASSSSDIDRIPVRLSQGRRAYLEIPSPFFEADKQRLKSQIDLLITDDAGDSF